MNIADIAGVLIIIAFTAAGIYLGTVRAFSLLIGVVLAMQVATPFMDRGMNHFMAIFIGVVAGCGVVGYLVYGATRFQPIDSMEGVFGSILGLCAGWGMARFVYHSYFLFLPDAAFTQAIKSSMLGMEIYNITPIQSILNVPAISKLRNPKI